MKANKELVRLRKVLLNDNIRIPNGMLKVLKTDITELLHSYFSLIEKQVDISIEINDDGIYDIKITTRADGVKEVRII